MTPIDGVMYLFNSILLGEEPTIEDFILLIGTTVAFIAFVLWCCFPVVPKDLPPGCTDVSGIASNKYTTYKKTDSYHQTMSSYHQQPDPDRFS
ncbi:unnamed protein product [Cyprideis torosa]|uniref:Uncharacterized protein n=1 Tax=Cyprideis torosa TaxID=163714 RepID=A0A7R8W7H3_9CRUS|nr:unnamed protein product [Cyprideis torosa]CAG0887579.1 unnamed protein product [Cyprideis torosa]